MRFWGIKCDFEGGGAKVNEHRNLYIMVVKKSGMPRTERKGLAARCGTMLPVSAINRYMKSQGFRLSKQCLAYVAGLTDYFYAEISELSTSVCKDVSGKSIDKKHVAMAISTDEELRHCFRGVEFLGVGHVAYASNYASKAAPKTAKASQQ